MEFNLAQRSHGNFLENVVQHTFMLLVAGIVFPRATATLGVASIVGRYLYATGYSKEPKKRVVGFIMSQFSMLVLLILAIYSAYSFVK